jgi:hypothetical protein
MWCFCDAQHRKNTTSPSPTTPIPKEPKNCFIQEADMPLETIEVSARWENALGFIPVRVTWQDRVYQVQSTGRHWEDAEGWHVLCMLAGSQAVELVFRLQPAGWLLRLPADGSLFA